MNKTTGIAHVPPGFYEQEVDVLGGAMLRQLRDNEHVGNWQTWTPTISEMELMIARTWHRIKIAHASENPRRAAELSADLANLAMKCFSTYGKQ